MTEKENKKIIETVKTEAKEYYSGKNMIIRYIILGFLLILIVIQFILPHKTRQTETGEETLEIQGEMNEAPVKNKGFEFLGKSIDFAQMDTNTKIKFDKIIKDLQYDLEYKYTLSQYYLPKVFNIFENFNIPHEFAYIAILNNFEQPYRNLEKDLREFYGLTMTSEIDETLNTKKTSEAISLYFSNLYDEFNDWNLVLLAYFMGKDELNYQMDIQGAKDFESLFIPNDTKEKYLKILAYSYIFDNIDEYINVENLSLYTTKNDTHVMVSSEIKDLIKWCKKNKVSYKEIKELNPWILGNSLPKGTRELIVKD